MEHQRTCCRRLSRPLALASLLALAASTPILTQAKEMDTDRPGSDYKTIVLDADFCENQCENDSSCKAWTYVKPGTIQGQDARCWLKTSAPPPVKNNCCISGYKSTLPDISTSGDLAAFDWCYDLNQAIGNISFYPVIKNVGPYAWASAKEGYYQVGAAKDGVFSIREATLPAFPHFWLEQGEEAIMSHGFKMTFSDASTYNLDNIWFLYHTEDANDTNNRLYNKMGPVSGKTFLENGALYAKRCKR